MMLPAFDIKIFDGDLLHWLHPFGSRQIVRTAQHLTQQVLAQ
jgi:hypothetical protein